MVLSRSRLTGKCCAAHFHHPLNVMASKPRSQKGLGIITEVSNFDRLQMKEHIKSLAVNQPDQQF